MEKERPRILGTETVRVKTGCGELIVRHSLDPSYHEVYAILGKPGTCAMAYLDALNRITTKALNAGVTREEIVNSLSEIRCPQDSNFLPSCPMAMARVLGETNEK